MGKRLLLMKKGVACLLSTAMVFSGITMTPGSSKIASAADTNSIKVITDTTDDGYTDVVDASTGWWSGFSNYYKVSGDFDVTFTLTQDTTPITQNWNTPTLAITSDADRGATGYTEYLMRRTDHFTGGVNGKGDNQTGNGVEVTLTSGYNWDTFKTDMAGATHVVNAKRNGNDFIITDMIKKADGGRMTDYVVSFTDPDIPTDLRMFWTGDTEKYTITSYKKTEVITASTSDDYTDVVDASFGWWTGYSNYYKVSKDFDVTFTLTQDTTPITESWNSPTLAVTSDAARGATGYTEYLMRRTDNYMLAVNGKDPNQTGNGVAVTVDSALNLDNAKTDLVGATHVVNVKREGDGFVITDKITKADGGTMTDYVVSFTDPAMPSDLRLFWTGDTEKHTISSYVVNNEEKPTTSEPAKTPTSVTLNKKSVSMEKGDTVTLVATVLPEDAVNKDITWKSDNTAVAEVDNSGKVTAVGAGTATITAESKENAEISATCKVTVTEQSGNIPSGGTITDESQLGTYRSDLAYSRVGVHDPSIVKDPDTGRYYLFGSHCAWAWSDDLENWTSFANNITEGENGSAHTIFADEIAWCKKSDANYTVKGNLWAPDVIWDESYKNADGTTGAWLMYMSINGHDWNSTISLLTAKKLDGDWTYVGPVIQSGMSKGYGVTFDYTKVTGDTEVNSRYTSNVSKAGNPTLEAHAIDACVLYDDNGDLWMSYGSWSGGISMIKLDKETGLRDYSVKYADTNNVAGADGLISDPYTGYKIAGGAAVSGEGSYIKKIGDYYYLFLSYGGYAPSEGYNMRVFRSDDIKGPYKDVADKDARQKVNGQAGGVSGSTGMRLMSYYKWSFADYGYTGQGHNSATVDEDGKAYVIYHNKYDDGTAAHEVRVHQLLMNEDGWILAAPFEYARETVKDSGYAQNVFTGDYSIMFQKQNVDHANLKCTKEQKIKLETGTASASGYTGNISGDYTGTWESKTGSPYISLTIGGITYKGVLCEGTIDETDVKTMTFTAVGSNQECLWGYKVNDPTVAIRMTIDKVIKLPDNVATDLKLPSVGVGGSTITWKSNSVAIADDGSVPHLFDEDSKVSMTATITNNGYEYSKVYEFTVVGNAKLSSDSDVVLKTFYADSELDMSRLSMGNCPKVDNPFYYTHEDISGGVSISFDVVRTAMSDRLSNIISFNNKLGKLYFTGGSYLGYNDFNDNFMDANLNAGYVAGEDYLSDGEKVNIRIEILSSGFNVYQNETKVYSSSDVKSGKVPGGYSAKNPETTMLSWLKTAPELNFGSGNFWPDLIFKGKISNVVCSYKQSEIDVNGGTGSSLSGLYTQDYEKVKDIGTEWTSTNAQEKLSLGSDDEHGKYMLYDFTGATGINSRGAHSYFGDSITWPNSYILEYDMSLKAGNNQESQVAVLTSNVAYVSKNENNGIDTGYVFKLTTTNSETWTVNGSDTVNIPKSAWVHVVLTGTQGSTAAHLKITNGDTVLFDKDITATDTGTVKGMYMLAGRYQATYKVDNIVVKEPGVDYVDRTAFDTVLARAEQYVAVQEQTPIYTTESINVLKDAIETAKNTVTNTSQQNVVNAQTDALKAAIAGLQRLTFTVVVGAAENGTVTGLAVDGKYYAGDSMSLTAVPASGYVLDCWKIGDDVVGKNTVYSAMVTENITITPVFKKGGTETPTPTPDTSSKPVGPAVTTIPEGLIAEYLFNGNLKDSKTPAKTAKIVAADDDNKSEMVSDAKRGSVMEMRGTWQATGYLSLDKSYVNEIDNAFTVNMWAKANNSKSGEEGICGDGASLFNFKVTEDDFVEGKDAYVPGFVSLDVSLGPWINDYATPNNYIDRTTNTVQLSDANWQMVTMSIDGDNNKIYMYVDGKFKGEYTLGGGSCSALIESIKTRTTDIQIGTCLPWWNIWDFRGYVDDVRLYSKVLTADEVTELYNMPGDESVIKVSGGDNTGGDNTGGGNTGGDGNTGGNTGGGNTGGGNTGGSSGSNGGLATYPVANDPLYTTNPTKAPNATATPAITSTPNPALTTPSPTPSGNGNGTGGSGNIANPTPTPTVPNDGQSGTDNAVDDGNSIDKADVSGYNKNRFDITSTKNKTVAYKKPAANSGSKVKIPATVKVTENGKKVTYKVTSIKKNAFKGNKKVKQVTVSKNIKTIGKNAFKNCSKMKKIKIKSKSIKKIGKNAFKGVSKNCVVEVPKSKKKAYTKMLRKAGLNKKVKIVSK